VKKIKKFRKNDWSDEEVVTERKNPKAKRLDRALRVLDIDYLSDYDEDY
jgi:hypothetical protein